MAPNLNLEENPVQKWKREVAERHEREIRVENGGAAKKRSPMSQFTPKKKKRK